MQSAIISQEEALRLKAQNDELTAKVARLEKLVDSLLEQERLKTHQLYGRQSERLEHEQQQSFFDEVENSADPAQPEASIEAITYQRRRRSRTTKTASYEALVSETIEHELPEDERACSCCGEQLRDFKRETRYELIAIPARVEVIKHVEHHYVCDHCEQTDVSTPMVKARGFYPVLPGSSASPELLSWIIGEKYRMASPLYRLEKQLAEQEGISLSRQTMSNWLLRANERYFDPMLTYMKRRLTSCRHLHADESGVNVLHEPGRASPHQSYMWLYRTGRDEVPLVIFDYRSTRASKHPVNVLQDFQGYLQVDGYSGYDQLASSTCHLVGCMAHARRKFSDVQKALPKGADLKATVGHEALLKIQALYKIEARLKEQWPDLTDPASLEAIQAARQKESAPLVDKYFDWCRKKLSTSRGSLKKAFQYSLNQRIIIL